MEYVTFFIYAFTLVFVLVNPVGGLITFVSLTRGMNNAERGATAKRSVLIACILALGFGVVGDFVLRFFHITVDNLRVAGGILLFVIALDMLYARPSRESVTPEELKEATRKDDITVFPVATPLLSGPGTLTTVLILMRTGKSLELKAVALAAILVVFLFAYVIFRSANRLYKFLGVTASLVITRVMGLLLAALAVNFVSVGAWNIYQSFL